MPAIRQDHHEGPGFAERPGDRIAQAARRANIHLGFAAGLTFHPYGGRRAMRLESVENAIERGQSSRVAALISALQDRGARHAVPVPWHDELAVGFDRRHRLRRWGPLQRRAHQLMPDLHRGSRRIEQALGRGPWPIPANRPTVQARRPLHRPQVRSRLQRAYLLTQIQKISSPSSHRLPPRKRFVCGVPEGDETVRRATMSCTLWSTIGQHSRRCLGSIAGDQ